MNRLRNIAINNIETSHFLYNDIDFMVSGNGKGIKWLVDQLYEKLMMIPESFMNQEKQAIIVPAFEYLPKMQVSQREFASVLRRYMPNVPKNKSSLAICLNLGSKECTIFRDKAHLHV